MARREKVFPEDLTLIQYLKQEAKEAHDAETFSRNGESTDFSNGEFSGRETLAKELIDILESGCKFKKTNGRIEPICQK